MALRQLRKVLLRRLLGGESVSFGGWGSFSISISSTGVDNKEEVTARNIKSVNLLFQPDAEFKADLNKAKFAWVDKLAEGKKTTSSEPTDEPEEPGSGSDSEGPDII